MRVQLCVTVLGEMGDRGGEEQEDSGEGEEEDGEGKLHIVGDELQEGETTDQKRLDHSDIVDNNPDRFKTGKSDIIKIHSLPRYTDKEEANGQFDKPSVEHSNEDIAVSI